MLGRPSGSAWAAASRPEAAFVSTTAAARESSRPARAPLTAPKQQNTSKDMRRAVAVDLAKFVPPQVTGNGNKCKPCGEMATDFWPKDN